MCGVMSWWDADLIDKEMTSLQRGGPVLLLYGCICPLS
ncbi:hypothetical protein SynSYN20_02529 [Synechococcus sp. SYN20]|nr:hypothetical protein SynMVIR181_02416 [Synechococcus sp. MVIR-18-1]QNJ26845.1 hypothetical protein SynSYN20_02529 [Synechococcus sp. SYN20]